MAWRSASSDSLLVTMLINHRSHLNVQFSVKLFPNSNLEVSAWDQTTKYDDLYELSKTGQKITFPLCLPPWTTIHTQTPNKLVNPIPGVSRASYPVSNPHTIWTHSPWHTTTPHYNTIHSWRESWAGTTLHHWYAPTWPLYCIWLCIEENVLQLAIRQSRMGWEAVVWKGLARFTTIGCLHLNESRGLIPGDIRQ